MGKFVDLAGKQFGLLTVIGKTGKRSRSGCVVWECKCRCGKTTYVPSSSLIGGYSASCGCAQRLATKKANTTHGKSYEKIYRVWNGIKERCENPNNVAFKNYGGRGIELCEEWHNPECFIDWAYAHGYSPGKKLSIDRVDNDKGYFPENCAWVDKRTQQNNRRVNHHLTLNGETKTLSEWGETVGIKPNTILCRIRKGWTAEEALTTVVRHRG